MSSGIIICGPTATGKTSLALHVANQFPFEILSADSRQVYTDMNIGTGKDIPSNAKKNSFHPKDTSATIPYYQVSNTKIWGYDLVSPNQDFSISQYYQLAQNIITQMRNYHHIPIIVGGSGLYIKSIINPPKTLHIPVNEKMRHELNQLSLDQLQSMLKKTNLEKFNNMNHSDQLNPRRLIRAIEVNQPDPKKKHSAPLIEEYLAIGLRTNLNQLDQKIESRVKQRVESGFDQEVKVLIHKYPNWDTPAFSATGYQEWRQYLDGKLSQVEAFDAWVTREKQYARRQLTWFNKIEDIIWIDVDANNIQDQIVTQIENWYANTYEFQKYHH